MTAPLARRLASEFVGTAMLLAVVVGSGIMGERLSGGNDALALLGNTLATGAALYALILVFGPVSGAHLNPAVTLAFALRRDLPAVDAVAYAATQAAGALVGVVIAHLMFDLAPFAPSTTERQGTGVLLGEAVATFGLILTLLGALRWRPSATPAAVGLIIAAGYWFTSSTSFANPAVTIARTLTDTFSGVRAAHAPGFIAAEFAGALVATAFAAWLFAPEERGYRAGDAGASRTLPDAG